MLCYLIRHGMDDNTVRGGWSSTPLTDEGVRQVENLALRFASDASIAITHLYTSDLPRASQTAEVLAQQLHLPVTKLPEFRETNNGVLAGMKNEIANREFPGLYWSSLDWDEHYPGGESPHEFFDRICNAWRGFKKNMAATGADVALVTHAGVINAIMCIENNAVYTNRSITYPTGNAEWITVEI